MSESNDVMPVDTKTGSTTRNPQIEGKVRMNYDVPWHPVKGCNACEQYFPKQAEQSTADSNPYKEGELQKNYLSVDGCCRFHHILGSIYFINKYSYISDTGQAEREGHIAELEDELSHYSDYSPHPRNVRRSRQLLRDSDCRIVTVGYLPGVQLLIGISKTNFRLCLVVTPGEYHRNEELEAFRNFDCPSTCRKEVHYWRHGQKQPDIELIERRSSPEIAL